MNCEQLQSEMDAAYIAWQADPSAENFAALQAAQGAWAQAGCNVQGGPQGGGIDPSGPGGLD